MGEGADAPSPAGQSSRPGPEASWRREFRAVVAIAAPAALTQLGLMMMGVVDTMMLGRYSAEAMAAGARVVGSEVDGIPDILKDAENGWLARPADSDDLARALLDALKHPVGDDIADAGEQTALLHDWHRVAEEYALVLDEAIHD